MDRGTPAHPLSLLVIPVAAILVASGLTLPQRAFLGMTLHEAQVATVAPGGAAERAGIHAGDRLSRPPQAHRGAAASLGPLWAARPGVALALIRERGGQGAALTLTPEALPADERRMIAALFAVASGFVFLGGWVWSERRDRLTRPFVGLCLAFAVMLTPTPVLPTAAVALAYDLLYGLATLLLPALFIHFFALFPEPGSPRPRRNAAVTAGYGVAALLFVASIATAAARIQASPAAAPMGALLEIGASLWFIAGIVSALALFGRSYLLAGSDDARRRLRVALISTALGLAPLLAVIALRTWSPGTAVPGERLAVMLTLLVPAGFAWAIAVHRIFEFRLALRALVMVVAFAAAVVVAVGLGEALAGVWGRTAGFDLTGMALAGLGLAAALAGAGRPLGARVGEALVPTRRGLPLVARLERMPARREDDLDAVLARAAATLREAYKLDRCGACACDGARWHATMMLASESGTSRERSPELSAGFAERVAGAGTTLDVDEAGLAHADRDALDAARIAWVLPVGDPAPLAVLLLGHRLAGSWLDRREEDELRHFAEALAVEMENVSLRRAARSHGVLDRELAQAGAIQTHLLPRRAPIYPTLDCAAATLSAESVGGDYYDFVERGDREFTLVVGDAIGHGVPAALLLAGVQARFRSVARRGEMPGAVLSEINHELVTLDQPEKFVGLLCARVDVRMGRLHLANAGLTPPLLRRRDGRREVITDGGLVLGVSDAARYPDLSLQLHAGDVALLYTDGLTEGRRGEELFGLERVADVLDRHAHRRARDILDALLAEVNAFAEPPLDDLTVLVLKQLAEPQPELRAARRGLALRAGAPAAAPALQFALKSPETPADTSR